MPFESDLTIVEALQQSRRRLLYDALPLFASTRPARAKFVSSTNLPPYELQHIITLTVSIGPHMFESTRLSRVAWTAPQAASTEPVQDSEATTTTITTTPLATVTPDLAATSIEALIAQNVASSLSTAATPASTNGANLNASSTSTRRPALALQFGEVPTDTYLVPLHFIFEPLPAGKAILSFILVPDDFKRLVDTATTKDPLTGEIKPLNRNYPVPMSIRLEQSLSKAVKVELESLSCSKGKERQKVEVWWNRMITLMPTPTHIVKPRPPTPPPPPEPRDFSLFISAAPYGLPPRSNKLASGTPTEGTPGSSTSGTSAQANKKRKRPSTSAASRRRSSAATAKRRESSVSSSTPGRGSSATPGHVELLTQAVPRVSSSLKEVVSATTMKSETKTIPAPVVVPAVTTKSRSGRTHRPKSFGQEFDVDGDK
ncbi:BZ3500_MvSof-1268-A1-R1_Chr7-1g09103 [Microbotryum saponariae]|uniref:BZ3500_MvSof-1268-A1-R1_Chr7-1g09103 protein n=1 Tax=Microbotryum saponariae TaxID=289078 RepID=A0A2X0N1A3_9BASI|nr:BZ3501_MvSof-1269-A2-R1_Chr7-1g08808 [Microbotryum saponariae]SDA02809.1 BZ3500_MvSof-1268-A1-R1_Chr7-1g09103 [Microbotryum saponariae]